MKTIFLLVMLSLTEPVGISLYPFDSMEECDRARHETAANYQDLEFTFACVGVEFEV